MKLPSPPLPRPLRRSPPRPGQESGGRNGRNGAPATKPTPKEQAVEGVASVVGWLDERTGTSPFLRGFLYRKVPKGTNWFYTLGSASMFAFLSQAVTGVFLAMYYDPDRDKPSPSDGDKDPQPYVAISTRCAHLGCPVRYIQASQKFVCPCHGGVYGFQGEVEGGPPVRPLDRFYTRVTAGRVEVGDRFSLNSQLERFSPRDPSNHLDGLWQYLYPSRPTT